MCHNIFTSHIPPNDIQFYLSAVMYSMLRANNPKSIKRAMRISSTVAYQSGSTLMPHVAEHKSIYYHVCAPR